MQYSRTIYDILRYLGDVGGLAGSLIALVSIFFSWYPFFKASAFVMEKVFVQPTSNHYLMKNVETDEKKENL